MAVAVAEAVACGWAVDVVVVVRVGAVAVGVDAVVQLIVVGLFGSAAAQVEVSVFV